MYRVPGWSSRTGRPPLQRRLVAPCPPPSVSSGCAAPAGPCNSATVARPFAAPLMAVPAAARRAGAAPARLAVEYHTCVVFGKAKRKGGREAAPLRATSSRRPFSVLFVLHIGIRISDRGGCVVVPHLYPILTPPVRRRPRAPPRRVWRPRSSTACSLLCACRRCRRGRGTSLGDSRERTC